MRPLLKSIRPVLVAAIGCSFSSAHAVAQNLQWQHASNNRPAPAASTPVASSDAVEYSAARTLSPATAKRPTSALPAPLPDMGGARRLSPVQTNEVYGGPGPQANVAPAVSLQQPADGPRTFARPANKLARAVKQSQWEEISTPDGVPQHTEVIEQGPRGSTCGPHCNCQGGHPQVGFGIDAFGWGEPGCGVEPGCACEPACDYVEPGCGCGDESCADCCDTCETRPRGCVPIYIYVPPVNEFHAFAGVQGFKSPFDSPGDRGNFGFHEGFNLGGEMSWIAWPGLAYQFGFRATQNQLNDDASHSQQFLTTGLFRRAKHGLQYGVVFDLMHDERQGGNDFDQIRGEISYATGYGRDFGFLFAAQTNARTDGSEFYQASDQFLLFYRLSGMQGGELRLFAGFDDDSNGIFGSDFSVPLSNRWSLDGGWTYLHGDDNGAGASANEGWNIGMSLVWHWGCRAKACHSSPYRPLFNVADNGSMIIVDR